MVLIECTFTICVSIANVNASCWLHNTHRNTMLGIQATLCKAEERKIPKIEFLNRKFSSITLIFTII